MQRPMRVSRGLNSSRALATASPKTVHCELAHLRSSQRAQPVPPCVSCERESPRFSGFSRVPTRTRADCQPAWICLRSLRGPLPCAFVRCVVWPWRASSHFTVCSGAIAYNFRTPNLFYSGVTGVLRGSISRAKHNILYLPSAQLSEPRGNQRHAHESC